jgi:hypothetical protein
MDQLQISRSVHCALAYREKQHSGFEMAIAILEKDSKFVHSAVANNCTYVVDKRPLSELCVLLAIRILIANSCTRLRGIFLRALTAWGTGGFF